MELCLSARSQELNELVEESITNDEDANAPLDSRGRLGFSNSNGLLLSTGFLMKKLSSKYFDQWSRA